MGTLCQNKPLFLCHHSLPSPTPIEPKPRRLRISSKLWTQKVQGLPPRNPFYAPAGRAVHPLLSSATERLGISQVEEWLVWDKSESVLRIILPRTVSTKVYLGCDPARGPHNNDVLRSGTERDHNIIIAKSSTTAQLHWPRKAQKESLTPSCILQESQGKGTRSHHRMLTDGCKPNHPTKCQRTRQNPL
ncbi:hypothetical protein AVEN_131539-1 [Araneus ventricosus]|uniref:Uncharacterized protein n=1 Tax=Araneus ventricosus TaxID=182803 RepID=A0A4Y2M0P3_ARAVE|nr:hypothetical protein AVEN_131539-1 [Araneus ventricosus]